MCRTDRVLDRHAEPGLYILCDECLAVLRVDALAGTTGDVPVVRALAPDDLVRMPSDVYLEILEAKAALMRQRLFVGNLTPLE